MLRSSQSETISGSPPTYRTRFPIEIPFVSCSFVRASESSTYESDGLVMLGGLLTEICVRSRAETRASIAQNLEGGNEGARDRVVTGLYLGLP